MSIDLPDEYQANQTGTGICSSPPDDQASRPLTAGRKRGRNLGLGSRNLTRAGKTCAHQSGKAFATRGTLAERWSVFAKWLEQTQGGKRMEDINRDHVMAYGQALKARVERDELKASTAQLYVSAVNSIMTSATQGEWQTVSPTRDCGIPKRRYIPETSKAMPQAQHDQLQACIDDERIVALLNLQRTLGLRFKESALLDAQKALGQAHRENRITVFSGTKGGKRRHVLVSTEAMAALETAASLQDGRLMIPANLRYVDFRDHCYRQAQQLQFQFHGQRHNYAQQRYQALTGVPAPINTDIAKSAWPAYMAMQLHIDESTAEKLDQRARRILSQELGHERLEVVCVYIG
ncbi:integrase domain-containing protein [Methylomonas montana]|uniref:integrase domain-containing protein n=1 Tax=Methylomonas montana TaxID=3058963 RepID=UPI002659FF98|nr:integrase domain-containing protein [Methylomonas montana]WKJ88548.1 integrase domain-containing protein [Methylomonas montana]